MNEDVKKSIEVCKKILAHKGRCDIPGYDVGSYDDCPDKKLLFLINKPVGTSCEHYLAEHVGDWEKFSKKELWDKIQEVRQLVGSDGTRDICDDIKSYAERYDSASSMTKREQIAAMAMQGMLSNMPEETTARHMHNMLCEKYDTEEVSDKYINMVVTCAVNYADALIKKLEETK